MIDDAPQSASAIPLNPDPQPDASGQQDLIPTQISHAAQPLIQQAKQKFAGALDSQKGAAADFVEKLATNMQGASEQFGGQQDWIASAISRGAAEVKMIADSLRDKDFGDLVDEVQSFARRQPALFIGASVAAGFAAARLGKLVTSDLSHADLPTLSEAGHGQH